MNVNTMVRKTKEEAEQTRQALLEAARKEFLHNGVSQTSLQKIAQRANVTRGAVYHHFANKSDLLQALKEQIFVPLIDLGDHELAIEREDPLHTIALFLDEVLDYMADDKIALETFYILSFGCEYVGELAELPEQMLCNCLELVEKLIPIFQKALDRGTAQPDLNPRDAAMSTYMFLHGQLRMFTINAFRRQTAMDYKNLNRHFVQGFRLHAA